MRRATSRRPPLLPLPLRRPPWRRWVRRVRRSPVAWWLAAAAVAATATAQVGALDDEAAAARAAWGEGVPVAVAVRSLPAGHVVGADDVVVASWPAALVPRGALAEAPTGRTVAAPVVAGEALVAARVAPEGLSAVAALVPPGWRAVAVPAAGGGLGGDLPPLEVGDRVDVLAVADPYAPADLGAAGAPCPDAVEGDCGGGGGGGSSSDGGSGSAATDGGGHGGGGGTGGDGGGAAVVAAGGLVVDVGDAVVTVAVPAAVAPAVVAATTRGSVGLAIVGAS